MKNIEKSRTWHLIKSIFNVRYWSDYDRIKEITRYLLTAIKILFIPQKANPKNTKQNFKHAKVSMKLSEKKLLSQQKSLHRLAWFMCLLAILLSSYSFYHLRYGTLRAFFVSNVLVLLALALAFRYHFWYYQIKEQKLGCSFKEWFRKGLLGRKS